MRGLSDVPGSQDAFGWSGMNQDDPCRVDDCARQAAASVVRDDLPGPMRLCATHTEDFRINGGRWNMTWDPFAETPISVRPPPQPAVGRDASVVPLRSPAPSGPLGPARRSVANRLSSVWHRLR